MKSESGFSFAIASQPFEIFINELKSYYLASPPKFANCGGRGGGSSVSDIVPHHCTFQSFDTIIGNLAKGQTRFL